MNALHEQQKVCLRCKSCIKQVQTICYLSHQQSNIRIVGLSSSPMRPATFGFDIQHKTINLITPVPRNIKTSQLHFPILCVPTHASPPQFGWHKGIQNHLAISSKVLENRRGVRSKTESSSCLSFIILEHRRNFS